MSQQFEEIFGSEFATPNGSPGSDSEERKRFVAAELARTMSPEELEAQLRSRNFFGDHRPGRDAAVRKVLIEALVLADGTVESLLSVALDNSRYWHVRRVAIDRLSERGNKADLRQLLGIIKDEDIEPEIRIAALKAVSLNGVTEALTVIAAASFDRDVSNSHLQSLCARAHLGDKKVLYLSLIHI